MLAECLLLPSPPRRHSIPFASSSLCQVARLVKGSDCTSRSICFLLREHLLARAVTRAPIDDCLFRSDGIRIQWARFLSNLQSRFLGWSRLATHGRSGTRSMVGRSSLVSQATPTQRAPSHDDAGRGSANGYAFCDARYRSRIPCWFSKRSLACGKGLDGACRRCPLGPGLSSIQILPTLYWARESGRGGINADTFDFSIAPWQCATYESHAVSVRLQE